MTSPNQAPPETLKSHFTGANWPIKPQHLKCSRKV